jgi:hypothetical protein
LCPWLHQEAINTGELIFLLRENYDLKLFVYDVRNGEVVCVIGVVIGE